MGMLKCLMDNSVCLCVCRCDQSHQVTASIHSVSGQWVWSILVGGRRGQLALSFLQPLIWKCSERLITIVRNVSRWRLSCGRRS